MRNLSVGKTVLPQYDRQDIRHLGVKPDKIYVFSSCLLDECQQLRMECCDHYDAEQLLATEKVLQSTETLLSTKDRLYVYFVTVLQAHRFLERLNEFLKNRYGEQQQ